jgi:hypothetical protein
VCVYKRTTKRPKHNFSKIYATSSNNNNKTKHEKPPLRTAHSLRHTASSNPIAALSHTRRRKVERRMFPLLFFLFIFVAKGELKYQREKIGARDSKTS